MMFPAMQENGPGDIPISSLFLAEGDRKISTAVMSCTFSFSHFKVSTISLNIARTIGSDRLPFAFVWATDTLASG